MRSTRFRDAGALVPYLEPHWGSAAALVSPFRRAKAPLRKATTSLADAPAPRSLAGAPARGSLPATRRAEWGGLDPRLSANPAPVSETEPYATLTQFCQQVASSPGGASFARGVQAAGSAWLSCTLREHLPGPLVLVAHDSTEAQACAHDLAHFAARTSQGRDAPTLLLPPDHSPYDAVHPDRPATLARLDALTRLGELPRPDFIVTSAEALCLRYVPPSLLRASNLTLSVGQALDLQDTVEALVAAGYARQPLVEDPGTLAVRGGLLDIWSFRQTQPVRLEFSGDELVGAALFDPDTQTTEGALQAVQLPPATELLLPTAEARDRAERALRELCDAHNYPSSRTRQLVADTLDGRQPMGQAAFLPAASPLVSLFDHLPESATVVIADPVACATRIEKRLTTAESKYESQTERPRYPVDALFTKADQIVEQLRRHKHVLAHTAGVLGTSKAEGLAYFQYVPENTETLELSSHTSLERALREGGEAGRKRSLAPLARMTRDWLDEGFRVTFTARSASQAERLRELLTARGLDVAEGLHQALGAAERARLGLPERVAERRFDPSVELEVGPLSRGLIAPRERQVFVSESEVLGSRNERSRAARPKRSPPGGLDDLRALKPGDRVVHVEHGVGRYLGLEARSLAGGQQVELLALEYKAGDKLFVPVYRMNHIQKLGSGDTTTKLDRLGGSTFAKTKSKVRRKVRQMADQLLSLYAERANSERPALPPADADYLEFETAFPYEETTDQAAAIADIMADLQKPQVMDRLICGDVGFGKTEVALRAAFRHIAEGKQVALLCPTTLLASQHFETAQKRFEGYAVNLELLSRFVTKKRQGQAVVALREGRADLAIGTHRLLSKDVHFKRLGLLIVDEEQRFGVAAKERIKQLRKDIDVLTLSATPIPRTLQMAIGGLQDLSVIRTPPPNRRPVRTVVAGIEPPLIAEAVERELERGGQVYYVHNRVEGLYERADRLRQLVPRARLAVAHGRMSETELEKTMIGFVKGQADVLVASAIVESGLDIPRANTLIIDRADLFGLAQLYQLRGRVGRSSERAYCYLLVPPPSKLSDEARMRIEAISRYTELGSGLKLAELDLELRGAGDFLGAEQSGVVASVGFELFCEMLRDATRELRGEPSNHDIDPEITLDLEAHLPENYIDDVGLRLSLYKRLAGAENEAAVESLAEELNDRFGPLPPLADNLVALMRLKANLRALRVLSCEASRRSVTFHLRDDTPIRAERMIEQAKLRPQALRVTPEGRVVRRPTAKETGLDGLGLACRLVEELSDLSA